MFSENGYDCVSFDQMSYGASKGCIRGYISSRNVWVDVGVQFLNRIAEWYLEKEIKIGKDVPVFILG